MALLNGAKRAISASDTKEAFIRAVHSYSGSKERWQQRKETGLNDEELYEALRYALGTEGGSSGSDMISIHYSSSNLRIWASWECCYPIEKKDLICEGKKTVAMARELLGISDPNLDQLSMF